MTRRWPSLDSLATIGLIAATFVSSFATIADYAVRTGVATPATSWAWPVAVDGLVIVATLRGRALARSGQPVGWARAAASGALCASVAVNMAHAPATTPARLMAALVPASLAVGLHLPRPRGVQEVVSPDQAPGQGEQGPDHVVTPEQPVLTTPVQNLVHGQDVVIPDHEPGQGEQGKVSVDSAEVTSPWPPDRLTAEAVELLIIEHGSESAAAKAAGVSRSTLRRRRATVDTAEVST